MAGRDSTTGDRQSRKAKARRRRVVIMGGAAGAFIAAAAMATGSAVTAAPAKADIDALLDPIIQPLMTSLTDAISGFDPAAATDLTSWTDSLLSSLNSIDLALPSTAESAAAAAATTDTTGSGPFDIPLSLAIDTEPTVQATVDGASNTLLVDTGSSGLVIPWDALGSNDFSALLNLFELGWPTSIGESGYSGGVDYVYLTYNTTVDYTTSTGSTLATNTPVDVEVLSWPTSFTSPSSFDAFLADDHVTGILGIGDGVGPAAESPLQAAGFSGVTVDIPGKELVVGGPPISGVTISDAGSGAPITDLFESVGSGTPVPVSDDVDSGGVYGTIPSSLVGSAGSLPSGTVISVYDNAAGTGTPLYTYTVGTDSLGQSTAPTPVSGNSIDSGIEAFLKGPIYINYTDDSITFGPQSS